MNAIPREVEQELADTSKYVRVPARTIFDEHDEVYHVDAGGRPCRPDAPGAKKKVRRFTREKLEEIARRCNRRDATGSLAPLCFGHTDPDQKDETKQPAPRGYACGYSVAYSPELGRNVLRADFYVKKAHYQQARTFPRVSIELWERHGVIDPISLLRRSPARDLGQWTYSRKDGVLRYSMGDQMDDMPDDAPPPGEGAAEVGGPTPEEHEQYARHCYSHPLAQKFSAHYAMPEEPEVPEPMGRPDPTAAPDAEEPLMHGMAVTGASNGAVPKPAAPAKGKPTQFAKDMEASRISKMEREIALLRRERDGEIEGRNLEAGRRWVATLAGEGFELDPDEEALAFSKLDEAGRARRAESVRRYHRQAPVGYDRAVPVAKAAGAREADGIQSDGHFDRALQYTRANGCSFEEALEQTRTK